MPRLPFATAKCNAVREQFSAYLDGDMTGLAMQELSAHLERCNACTHEFAAWRSMQSTLGELGPAQMPAGLQTQLRSALAAERDAQTHLSATSRLMSAWRTWLAPMALRAAGGLALAAVVVGGLSAIFAAPIAAVEANDDRMAHLTAPHFLYSEVPPEPVTLRSDALVLVDAKVDETGRVYDFSVVEGPTDPNMTLRIEENLLSSVFRPAMVFGTPVRGHVMLTYTGVSVRG